jgi:EpsI family protein
MTRTYVKALLLMSIMLGAAVSAHYLRPELGRYAQFPHFDEKLPAQIGEWTKVDTLFNGSYVSAAISTDLAQPYNELVERTYKGNGREYIMLVLAWGQEQKQEVKVHNPELCYKANGFQILQRQTSPLRIKTQSGETIMAKHMLTQDMQGYEAVTYWVRVGDSYSESSMQTRISIIEHGLRGEIPDGILVRASQRITKPDQADTSFQKTQQFLEMLYAGLPANAQAYLLR